MTSIIVPTYNRAGLLDRCLAAVLAMAGVEACQILVVDDGSTDDTCDVVARHAARHPGLSRLHQTNAGPGEARNLGISKAMGRRILFLDDDAMPEPGLLQAHLGLLDAGWDVSQGCLFWHPDIVGDPVIRFMDARGMQFVHDGYVHGQALRYLHVYTANLCLDRAWLDKVHGFDKRFAAKRYAFEDTSFAYRLQQAGARIAYNARARAAHLHPYTADDLVRREYKTGFASSVLATTYPAIAADLGLADIVRYPGIQSLFLGAVLGLGLHRFLGFSLGLRLRCRHAFVRGHRDGLTANRERAA
jgi:glycosyltransferase involved in cell wall biosynthesis